MKYDVCAFHCHSIGLCFLTRSRYVYMVYGVLTRDHRVPGSPPVLIDPVITYSSGAQLIHQRLGGVKNCQWLREPKISLVDFPK